MCGTVLPTRRRAAHAPSPPARRGTSPAYTHRLTAPSARDGRSRGRGGRAAGVVCALPADQRGGRPALRHLRGRAGRSPRYRPGCPRAAARRGSAPERPRPDAAAPPDRTTYLRRLRDSYHLDTRKPPTPGRCDSCGQRLVQRADDTEETARTRLAVDTPQTRPPLPRYRLAGVVHVVDGCGDAGDFTRRLLAALPTHVGSSAC
ncbi:hypothetical protein [Streptomyces bungoensis]|uniref:adenylate kinase family protein n=1 Tax=Streptomyces bungoensis TaxID=285568 RepID=UPI00131C2771